MVSRKLLPNLVTLGQTIFKINQEKNKENNKIMDFFWKIKIGRICPKKNFFLELNQFFCICYSFQDPSGVHNKNDHPVYINEACSNKNDNNS